MSKISLLINKILPQKLERALRTFRDVNFRRYNDLLLPAEIYTTPRLHKVSFCTTCMNRLFHLRHTIEKNIRDNEKYSNVEFVLVDYNSQDGLEQYVKKNLALFIENGLLTYYKTTEPERFHASKAKNLSHLLATGDIVCNVDADNFTGTDFAFYINHVFNRYGEANMFQFHKPPFWGTVGRLAFWKRDFIKLGGYDEALLAIGHEDADLIDRGRAMGYTLRQEKLENFQRYLSNTRLEKSINCADTRVDYYELENENRKISQANIANGRIHANPRGFSNQVVSKNFEKKLYSSCELIQQLNRLVDGN